MNKNLSLSNWIAHVFNHPLADPAWYWSNDAPEWNDTPKHVAVLITETFERSGELLAQFSDAQLAQALWYLVSNNGSGFMFSLVEPTVPIKTRLRALQSFVPLFEQVMAQRCSPYLSHLDEQGANPLNAVCYMWWDILPIHGQPGQAGRDEFDTEVQHILKQLLSIPHDACRESALHGISEWQLYYPQIEAVVDEWLAGTTGLRPELVSYAQRAKIGKVL